MTGSAKTYITNPIDVQVFQWTGDLAEMHFVVGWILANGGTAWIQNSAIQNKPEVIRIECGTDLPTIYPKDYVVLYPDGEFRIVKPKNFDTEYSLKESANGDV